MATKNLVPRATGEGQIGLSSKKWSQANFVSGSFDTLTVNGQSVSGGGSSTLAGLSDTDISAPSTAQILVHDGVDSFNNVFLSGDATIDSTGVLTIANTSITNDMLAGSIANTKLLNSSITLNSNSLSLGGALTLDTGEIGEGSNLYYTDERVDDRVNSLLTAGTNITLSYDDNANTLTINSTASGSGLTDIVDDTSPQLGNDLDVNGQDIVSVSNGNITLIPNGTGVVRIDGTSGIDLQSGEISVKNSGSVSNIKLYCESANAHYTQLQSAAHSDYSGNVTLTLPVTTGTLICSGDSGTVTNAMLNSSVITGQTAETSIDDADLVLIYDDSASALRKMTKANFVSGLSGGGGGGFQYSPITANTTALASYHYSVNTSNNAVTLSLPARSGIAAGTEIRVKLTAAGNDLTIDGNSTETIDGSATLVLNVANQSVTLVAGSATNWEII
jgi:hypothetical protein